MLRSGRSPRDKSEQVILNNFRTMQEIIRIKEQPLTPELVLDIHRMVTARTMVKADASGRFRRADETVRVMDDQNQVLHHPPSADELSERMRHLCDFANGNIPDHFIPPVIRAILLHFRIAYDHPFVDGNGRTARADLLGLGKRNLLRQYKRGKAWVFFPGRRSGQATGNHVTKGIGAERGHKRGTNGAWNMRRAEFRGLGIAGYGVCPE